ncbi:hypothetical protein JSY36_11695 [Bacillus sp. H-16]|uniref:hypothetical protein n=1 Tax=Alteribacter salitolerans TaxID=2912333 RepID=UPI0019665E6F|nr:hypothetical protein [Alteribacter salitolerans]MBM7096408.1 hypothetical protein [Alteribacter salitolerans]
MMKQVMWLFCCLALFSGFAAGCGNSGEDGAMEYTGFTNQADAEKEKGKIINFLSEAESHIRKPLSETQMNEEGVTVFQSFTTKDELDEYLQQVLSDELADTVSEKMTDLGRSREGEYLAAVRGVRWPTILDADPLTINIVEHSKTQTVMEMDVVQNGRTNRLQYKVMKESDGENPKVVQKTIQYN